jgi:hypothetical protein
MTSAPVRDLAWQPQFGGWPATPQRRLGREAGRAGKWPCRPDAQEFGDHPDAAASRMRRVRQLAQTTGGGR